MNDTLTNTEARPVRENQNGDNRGRYVTPRVNVLETQDGYVLQAEMPGVTKSGLEILVENNELTLVGHRPEEKTDAELIYRESSPRDFRRVFALDPAIDAGKINAKLEGGVLTVELPKAERVKPRRITVTA
jgi:HSP20 family protein